MPEKTFPDALNEQIANEFAASQQYVAAAVYYLNPIPDLWNALKLPSARATGNAGVVLAALTVVVLTVVPGLLWAMVRI